MPKIDNEFPQLRGREIMVLEGMKENLKFKRELGMYNVHTRRARGVGSEPG